MNESEPWLKPDAEGWYCQQPDKRQKMSKDQYERYSTRLVEITGRECTPEILHEARGFLDVLYAPDNFHEKAVLFLISLCGRGILWRWIWRGDLDVKVNGGASLLTPAEIIALRELRSSLVWVLEHAEFLKMDGYQKEQEAHHSECT
jgi:hypothetical protein